MVGHLNQYPSNLQGDCSLPFLFSPNFDLYVDVDFKRNKFVIRKNKVFSNFDGEVKETDDIYLDIPDDLIKI